MCQWKSSKTLLNIYENNQNYYLFYIDRWEDLNKKNKISIYSNVIDLESWFVYIIEPSYNDDKEKRK